jgi:hypothetical protein
VAKKANPQDPIGRIFGEIRLAVDRSEKDIRKKYPNPQSVVASQRQPLMVATRNYIPSALFRDITIQKYSHLSDPEICAKLDSDVPQGDSPSIGLPAHWTEKFKVKTFSQAYADLRCRNLVQKMISKAKNHIIYSLPRK